jgi:hypothetical protein
MTHALMHISIAQKWTRVHSPIQHSTVKEIRLTDEANAETVGISDCLNQ